LGRCKHLQDNKYFGLCKFDEVLIGPNYYGIDTGCSYKNKLTAIELEKTVSSLISPKIIYILNTSYVFKPHALSM